MRARWGPRSSNHAAACALALSGLLLGTASRAGEIRQFEIQHLGNRYHLEARVVIDAPRDKVWQVLTDYAGLSAVSPRILESEVVGRAPPGVTRVRTLNHLCFLVFCRDLRHLQDIRALDNGDFESTTIPAQSELSYGHARWRLANEGSRTALAIDFTFAMDTHGWLPAFVGRLIAQSVLRSDTQALIKGIEHAANGTGEAPGH
jgi:hypothetical protein